VTITLSGTSNATATTGSDGKFSFSGLANGSYTIAPSKSGLAFTPTSQQVTLKNGNKDVGTITVAALAAPQPPPGSTYSITGTISPPKSGAVATLTLNDDTTVVAPVTAAGGFSFSGLANGTYKVTPSKSGFTFAPASQQVILKDGNKDVGTITVTALAAPQPASWNSLFTRAVVGVQLSAGSSLATQQSIFLDFNVTAPMPAPWPTSAHRQVQKQNGLRCMDALNAQSQLFRAGSSAVTVEKDVIGSACTSYVEGKEDLAAALDNLKQAATADTFEQFASYIRNEFDRDYSPIANRFWVWFNPSISAVPAQVSSLLSTVTTSSASASSLLTAQYNKVIQDVQLVGGIDISLIGPHHHWAPLGGGAVTGLSFVVAAGFSTPLAATSDNAQIFSIPSPPSASLSNQLTSLGVTNACTAQNTPSGCTGYLAFVPPSRTRFFLQDYGGLRWKTYYVKNKTGDLGGLCDDRERGQVCPIFPGTFDVTVGQNSAYSAGEVRGILLRTEAFYPLPFYPMLHVFFSGWVHATGRNQNTTPLVLNTADSSITVESSGVQTIVQPVINRDFYRLGMGLDLIQLIGKLTKKSSGTTPSTAAPAAN
jgi:hypothetical protein